MMDIKDIQEQAFERGRQVGRREATEERLAVLKGVELGEGLTAEQVVADLIQCSTTHKCRGCYHRIGCATCLDNLMRDAAAVIKALLCGGAVDDAACTGASGMPRATISDDGSCEGERSSPLQGGEDTNVAANCGNCANYDREKGEFAQACGVCKVMNRHGEKTESSEWKEMPMTNGIKEKLVELLSFNPCSGICNFCERFKDNYACEKHKKEVTADNMISNGVTVQEWIPVAERLPELKENPVLVVYDGCVWAAWKHDNYWELMPGLNTTCVTHWMPMPEPPKGE